MALKKRPLLLLVAFFGFSEIFAQEKIWTKQTKISEVLEFEKEISATPRFLSQNVSLSKGYFPLLEKYTVANPIIIQREPQGYLPVYAEYFFTPEDSVLRVVSYDWEKDKYGNFFDKQEIWKEESKKFETYNSEYEKVKNILLPLLGKPASTDTKAKEVNGDRSKYFTRESIWETEEFHAKLNMIFESMTYRVRFTMYWKK